MANGKVIGRALGAALAAGTIATEAEACFKPGMTPEEVKTMNVLLDAARSRFKGRST